MDITEFQSKINAYLTDYIKFADAKAGSILVFAALIGSIVSATSERILTAAHAAAGVLFWIGVIVIGTVGVSVTMALWHTVAALAPRTPRADQSLHSFPDIAAMTSEAFEKSVGSLTSQDIAKNYALHNHALAKIAAAKFKSIERAMNSLRFAVLAAFGLGLLFASTSSITAKKAMPENLHSGMSSQSL